MSNELQLIVTRNIVGQLDTNISELENYVSKKLKEYNPSCYGGDIASAKKDRAELNNAKKFLGQRRKQIISELMKPYLDFETRCKKLEANIDNVSKQIDSVVKIAEEDEKDAKMQLLKGIYESKKFNLVPLEKILNPKWLNKSFKLTDASKELDEKIKKVYAELKTVEEACNDETVVDTAKAFYLQTLDVASALVKVNELQSGLNKVVEESASREDREKSEKLDEQKKDVILENKDVQKRGMMRGLVAEALEVEEEIPEYEWTVSFTCSEVQAVSVKNFLTAQGIVIDTFEKLDF